jgi:hypothetical protein
MKWMIWKFWIVARVAKFRKLRSSECGLQPVVLSSGFSRPAGVVGDDGIDVAHIERRGTHLVFLTTKTEKKKIRNLAA